MIEPWRRQAERSCILVGGASAPATGVGAGRLGEFTGCEVQGDNGARGWDGSKAKVGGKKMGFLGGSTKRLLVTKLI